MIIHFYEKTREVVDLSSGKITEVCAFSDCGITASSLVVLKGSEEWIKRTNLVDRYITSMDETPLNASGSVSEPC